MSKNIFRIIGSTLLMVLIATTLSGCGKKTTSGSSNVIVWSFESEDAWKPVIKNFEKNNKGYKLIYQKQELNSDYENRVLNSITSGAGPDVWAMPNDWVYRHKEKLVPMPESLAKTINIEKKYVPAIKGSVYINNKVYALSPAVEPLMIYYNPKIFSNTLKTYKDENKGDKEAIKIANDLLRDIPKTWTDFVSASNIITETGVAGVALGTNTIPYSSDILSLLMLQNETSILSDDLKLASFNLPKDTSTGESDYPGARALEFYTSFADPGSENYCWDDTTGDPIDAFANEQVAMIFGYSSLQNTLLQKYPNFKYKKGYTPQLSDDASKIVDFGRFTAYGISRYSKNPGAGWNLVNELVNGNATDSFNSANRLYSSALGSNYDISIKSREGTNPEKLSLATAKSVIKGRYPINYDILLNEAIVSVNAGNQDAQGALDLAANKITELLRKETW